MLAGGGVLAVSGMLAITYYSDEVRTSQSCKSLGSTCLGVCRPFLSSDFVLRFCRQIWSSDFVLRFCRLKLFKYFLETRLQNEHALRALGSN